MKVLVNWLFLFMFFMNWVHAKDGGDVDNGGDAGRVAGTEKYVLMDRFNVLQTRESKSPGQAKTSEKFFQELERELHRIGLLIDSLNGLSPVKPDYFNNDLNFRSASGFINEHVLSDKVSYLFVDDISKLVIRDPINNIENICAVKSQYDAPKEIVEIARAGCTDRYNTYIVKDIFDKMSLTEKALFIIHERLHYIRYYVTLKENNQSRTVVRTNPINKDLKTNIVQTIRGLQVWYSALKDQVELFSKYPNNKQEIEQYRNSIDDDTFNIVSKLPKLLVHLNLMEKQEYRVYRDGLGLVKRIDSSEGVEPQIGRDVFLGVGTIVTEDAQIGDHSILFLTNFCSRLDVNCVIKERVTIVNSHRLGAVVFFPELIFTEAHNKEFDPDELFPRLNLPVEFADRKRREQFNVYVESNSELVRSTFIGHLMVGQNTKIVDSLIRAMRVYYRSSSIITSQDHFVSRMRPYLILIDSGVNLNKLHANGGHFVAFKGTNVQDSYIGSSNAPILLHPHVKIESSSIKIPGVSLEVEKRIEMKNVKFRTKESRYDDWHHRTEILSVGRQERHYEVAGVGIRMRLKFEGVGSKYHFHQTQFCPIQAEDSLNVIKLKTKLGFKRKHVISNLKDLKKRCAKSK